jgi:hypothetical protein
MAARDFTAFIMKCVGKTFPDADLNKGSPVWTFTINPIVEYVGVGAVDLQTREFIKTVLRSKYPGQELDKDGVIDDTLIKPAEALMAPVVREIQQIKTRQTLADLRFHTIESISDIALNFSIVPRGGDYARGPVRLYFAAPVNERVVPETYVEATSGGLRFFASSTQSISAAQMALNQENDLYYWDIRIVAEKPGSVYNVKAGSGGITRAPTLPRVVRVRQLYDLFGGLARDTVEDIASMLDSYPCTRSIGTRRGTVATIQALLGGARVLELVGMGDPEMQRDIIRGGEIQPEIVNYPSGNRGTGKLGHAVPDNASDYNTRWLEDPGADFAALFGSTEMAVTGYYMCMVWDVGTDFPWWVFSRITRVLSKTRVELEDRCIPVTMHGHSTDTCIRWGVFPSKLTLSQVPGGILWPDTPDGLVAIHDDEIHVGGCSDTFLLGTTVESTSTSMTAVSDETPVGFGVSAVTAVDGWDVYLDDESLAVEVLATASATRISSAVIEFASLIWGTSDFTAIEAGQVLEIPTAPTHQRYLIMYLSKNTATGALRVVLDDDPAIGGSPVPARIIKRRLPLGRDACLHIIDGSDAGYYKILYQSEGISANVCPGTLQGCRYGVRLDRQTATAADDLRWEITDTIDINLNAPKKLRVFGADLHTSAGGASVYSTSLDFSVYGVKKNDIVKIESGPDATKLHVLAKDPFGLGSHFLEFTDTLTSTATVSFSIYSATTPIALPLVSVSKVSLLDVAGSGLGLDVPYKDPLSAYTSEFTNLASGVKHESGDWTAGIASVGGVLLSAAAVTFNIASHPFMLLVWHRQLGYSPVYDDGYADFSGYLDGDMELPEGGFLRPSRYDYTSGGPYSLNLSTGWDDLVAKLNEKTPYPFWAWATVVEQDGKEYGRLLCRPFGAKLMVLACDSTWASAYPTGPAIRFDPFLNYLSTGETFVVGTGGLAVYTNHVTSKDLYYGPNGTTPTALASLHPPISLEQDLVDVYTGSNSNTKNTLMQVESSYHRFRIMGRRSYQPEFNVSARIGFPSSGTAKLYFRDPTDLEIGLDTRLTVDSDQTYWPDPLLNGPIVPGYPETEKPHDGYVFLHRPTLGTAYYTDFMRSSSEPDFLSLGVMPGDILEVTYKDLVTGRDWTGVTYDVTVTPQELVIRQTGQPEVTVTFPVATGYTIQDVIDAINQAMGSTMATQNVDEHIVLRWQESIEITGSAIGASKIMGSCVSNNLATSAGLWPVLEVGIIADGYRLAVKGLMSLSEISGSNLQFRILRKSTQRFSAQKMSETIGTAGFYYAEGEFLSWGVGNQFNIDADSHGTLSGHWSRGYYLTCENQELSYSMAEVPWIHIGNFFQAPTVSDDMFNDQVVLGGGSRVYYDRSPLVSSAQALETSREEKDTIQSALARHLFPHYVNFTVNYAGGTLPATVKPEIIDLMTGRDPREPLDVSDIIGVLTQFGANKVDMPIALAVLKHNEDRSQDLLIGDDRIETTRLTGFLPGNIILNRRP